MGQAYAPGLRVAKKTVIRKDRILPLKGEVVKNLHHVSDRFWEAAKSIKR